jgi:drug/metabolite transporter (DMT)-like permease
MGTLPAAPEVEAARASPYRKRRDRARWSALLLAVFVTLLWSSSYVFMKWAFAEIPPMYLATLRYALAFALLTGIEAIGVRGKERREKPPPGSAKLLLVAGISGYTVAQGLQIVGLFYLPAITTSFLLNFTPAFVLAFGWLALRERASKVQLLGLSIALVGAYLFFCDRVEPQGEFLGVALVLLSGAGWAIYLVVVRELQGAHAYDSLRLTALTMGIGVIGMAILSAATAEYAPLTVEGVIIIVWLAAANTALAFLLWNKALSVLPAFELAMLQNAMMIEIALFAWAFLGEAVTRMMVLGMAFALAGILLVQMRALSPPERTQHPVS